MLTIIMPVHNTDVKIFKRACYSALGQTKPCLLMVVDDCSDEDNSLEYANFCAAHKIGYHRLEVNGGPGIARQYGIDFGYINADWIAFLDSDDILLPTFCEVLTNEGEKNAADMVVSKIVRQGKARYQDSFIEVNDCGTWLHGKIYRRAFLKENGIKFHPFLRWNEDVYFEICCMKMTQKVAAIDKEFYIWTHNEQSLTRSVTHKEFMKEHTIDYLFANIDAMSFLLSKEETALDLGTVVGQIYNAYQYELVNGRNMGSIDEYISLKIKNFNIDAQTPRFFEHMLNITKTNWEGYIFRQSLADWLLHFQEAINNGSNND